MTPTEPHLLRIYGSNCKSLNHFTTLFEDWAIIALDPPMGMGIFSSSISFPIFNNVILILFAIYCHTFFGLRLPLIVYPSLPNRLYPLANLSCFACCVVVSWLIGSFKCIHFLFTSVYPELKYVNSSSSSSKKQDVRMLCWLMFQTDYFKTDLV